MWAYRNSWRKDFPKCGWTLFTTTWVLSSRRQYPTPVLLPGKSHGLRSLVGCSPWGREESDTTERLHFQFSLSCIGEGNGNPLQCSCLENPRDGGVWWAAVYGVAQSRTRLKWLSSSKGIEHILLKYYYHDFTLPLFIFRIPSPFNQEIMLYNGHKVISRTKIFLFLGLCRFFKCFYNVHELLL